jgi:hypothetical protein
MPASSSPTSPTLSYTLLFRLLPSHFTCERAMSTRKLHSFQTRTFFCQKPTSTRVKTILETFQGRLVCRANRRAAGEDIKPFILLTPPYSRLTRWQNCCKLVCLEKGRVLATFTEFHLKDITSSASYSKKEVSPQRYMM